MVMKFLALQELLVPKDVHWSIDDKDLLCPPKKQGQHAQVLWQCVSQLDENWHAPTSLVATDVVSKSVQRSNRITYRGICRMHL
jgi:hypothetical protein